MSDLSSSSVKATRTCQYHDPVNLKPKKTLLEPDKVRQKPDPRRANKAAWRDSDCKELTAARADSEQVKPGEANEAWPREVKTT